MQQSYDFYFIRLFAVKRRIKLQGPLTGSEIYNYTLPSLIGAMQMIELVNSTFKIRIIYDTSAGSPYVKVMELWENYLGSRPDSLYDNPFWNSEEKAAYEQFDFLAEYFGFVMCNVGSTDNISKTLKYCQIYKFRRRFVDVTSRLVVAVYAVENCSGLSGPLNLLRSFNPNH